MKGRQPGRSLAEESARRRGGEHLRILSYILDAKVVLSSALSTLCPVRVDIPLESTTHSGRSRGGINSGFWRLLTGPAPWWGSSAAKSRKPPEVVQLRGRSQYVLYKASKLNNVGDRPDLKQGRRLAGWQQKALQRKKSRVQKDA